MSIFWCPSDVFCIPTVYSLKLLFSLRSKPFLYIIHFWKLHANAYFKGRLVRAILISLFITSHLWNDSLLCEKYLQPTVVIVNPRLPWGSHAYNISVTLSFSFTMSIFFLVNGNLFLGSLLIHRFRAWGYTFSLC